MFTVEKGSNSYCVRRLIYEQFSGQGYHPLFFSDILKSLKNVMGNKVGDLIKHIVELKDNFKKKITIKITFQN